MFASRSTVNSGVANVVLPLCFVLSGYAGMVYQVAWARQFVVEALPQFGINTPEDIFVASAADGQALRRMSHGARGGLMNDLRELLRLGAPQ